ncbi:hypothetical protein DFS34DRAFT_695506 [Phlyctochytrium arcticum]|nr:hypothetical protein DFS34DRAFT_695506 [Phlyctochytrium arcticum]
MSNNNSAYAYSGGYGSPRGRGRGRGARHDSQSASHYQSYPANAQYDYQQQQHQAYDYSGHAQQQQQYQEYANQQQQQMLQYAEQLSQFAQQLKAQQEAAGQQQQHAEQQQQPSSYSDASNNQLLIQQQQWYLQQQQQLAQQQLFGTMNPMLTPLTNGFGNTGSGSSTPSNNRTPQPPPPASSQAAAKPTQEMPYRCDTCEKSFAHPKQFETHNATHTTCSQCDFVASKKVVRLHEEECHALVDGVKKVFVSLDTPEQIAEWIDARKKKYPTDENIKKRQEEVKQSPADVSIKSEKTRKDRTSKKRKAETVDPSAETPAKKHAENVEKSLTSTVSVDTPSEVKSETPSEPQQNPSNGDVPPVPTPPQVSESVESHAGSILPAAVVKSESDSHVEKIPASAPAMDSSDRPSTIPQASEPIPQKDIIDQICSDSSSISSSDSENSDDGEIPTETPAKKKGGRICRYFMRGKCRKGDNCTFRHEKPAIDRQRNKTPGAMGKDMKSLTPEERTARRALIKMLLEPEIRQEKAMVLQCIKYMVKCNFFQQPPTSI